MQRIVHSSRGVLPSVMCRVWSRNLKSEETLAHFGPRRQRGEKNDERLVVTASCGKLPEFNPTQNTNYSEWRFLWYFGVLPGILRDSTSISLRPFILNILNSPFISLSSYHLHKNNSGRKRWHSIIIRKLWVWLVEFSAALNFHAAYKFKLSEI
jgi:hypothetical protein